MGMNSFSYGGWVELTAPDTGGGTAPFLQTGSNGGTLTGFMLRPYTPIVLVNVSDGTNRLGAGSTFNLSLNAWHHIFVTVNRSTNLLSLYIDGIPNQAGSISGLGSVGQNQVLTLGINGTDDITGYEDDVRIYNRALSAAEVQALYNAEK
jgi:hypothetical protein